MRKTPCGHFQSIFCISATVLAIHLSATAQVLQHQYSFWSATNGTPAAVDLVGTNTGTLGGSAVIVNPGTTQGQLQLNGSAYVQLQPGIVTNDAAVTIEAWGDFPDASVSGNQGNWANLFNFGTQVAGADAYSLSFCVNTGGSGGTCDAAISDFNTANVNRENLYLPGFPLNGATGAHVVAVWDPALQYSAVYINGVLQARHSIQSTILPGVAFGVAENGIQDNNNWIGKDNWPDPDMIGNLDEFRVWNGALNGLQIAASAQYGYTGINTNYGTITGVTLSAGPQVVQGGLEPATAIATASLVTNSADMSAYCAYASASTNIVTVDSSGNIHGINLGSTTVTASLGGVTSAPVMVTVIEASSILTHRYSFNDANGNDTNGIVKDSIGNLDGNLFGDAYETNGQVVLDGTVGTYVDLSSNAYANDGVISGYKSATIDMWATFGINGNWSYAYSIGNSSGNSGVNFLYFTFHGGNGTFLNDNGGPGVNVSPNQDGNTVHLTTVCDPNTGIWAIYTNGVVMGSITGNFTPLSVIATNYFWIGRSLWTALGPPAGAGDPYAIANFDEVRVYNGTLSSQQIATETQNGPNNTNNNPGTFLNVKMPTQSAVQLFQYGPLNLRANYTILTNWDILGGSIGLPAGLVVSVSNTNVVSYSGSGGQIYGRSLGTATITASYQGFTNSQVVNVVNPPAAVLAHRYSFSDAVGSLTATDSVGGAAWDGTLPNGGTFNGTGQLALDGTLSEYVSLPSGILSNYTAVTIEEWVTLQVQPTYTMNWAFGATDAGGLGQNYLFADYGRSYAAITGVDPGYNGEQGTAAGASQPTNTVLHMVTVCNPPAGYIALYTNGVLMSVNSGVTDPLSVVSNTYAYICKSVYSGDPYASETLDEFRMWDGALSPTQVANNNVLGPNQLPSTTAVTLTAAFSAGNVTISWPTSGSGTLHSSSSLGSGAVWTAVGISPTTNGPNYQVTVPTGPGALFFRLQ